MGLVHSRVMSEQRNAGKSNLDHCCSPITHRANQPSNTNSPFRSTAKVADEMNPCIAMIIGNVFPKKKVKLLSMTKYFGETRKSEEELQKYPEDIIYSMSRHFCTECTRSRLRKAKVEIFHGARVQETIFKQQSSNPSLISYLYGETSKKCQSFPIPKSNHKNAEREKMRIDV